MIGFHKDTQVCQLSPSIGLAATVCSANLFTI